MDIKDQVAIVTGGGSGIGAAVAQWLATLGAKVAVVDRQTPAAISIAEEIGGIAYACDVTDATGFELVLNRIVSELGEPRICVNCAGICPAAKVVSKTGPMPLADFEQVIQVNLVGTFNVMRLVAHRMCEAVPLNVDGERGVIINTASIAAYEGQIGQTAYSASKAGVIGLTLPAARELARHGVRVMAIAPGIIATPMVQAMPAALQENLAAQMLFPKRLGSPTEFAKLVQHIVENPLLNGSVIRLDAGMRMSAN
jgi:NAD(P)-dependent dehydrogenase (short-subunit alcohol dehydrogenase family)